MECGRRRDRGRCRSRGDGVDVGRGVAVSPYIPFSWPSATILIASGFDCCSPLHKIGEDGFASRKCPFFPFPEILVSGTAGGTCALARPNPLQARGALLPPDSSGFAVGPIRPLDELELSFADLVPQWATPALGAGRLGPREIKGIYFFLLLGRTRRSLLEEIQRGGDFPTYPCSRERGDDAIWTGRRG